MARPKIENHLTAQRILKIARKKFLKNGFAGTSINDIAKEGKINKSLIYHHFAHKENLWKAVKQTILEEAIQKYNSKIEFSHYDFKDYLKEFVTFRFKFYGQNPDIVKLINWQRLESSQHQLKGNSIENFTNITSIIEKFQYQGHLRQDIHPEIINYLILSISANGFIDQVSFLKTEKGRKEYLNIIVEGLYNFLKVMQ